VSGRLRLSIAVAAIFAAIALPAEGAAVLTIPLAREKAAAYAERTCSHDSRCARSGVRACSRQSAHVVLCRIFDHRKTDEQGNFLCTRLVRLALEPSSHRVPVTGVSNWAC
jgi:hypothetical protein